jgi:hypothetical protein
MNKQKPKTIIWNNQEVEVMYFTPEELGYQDRGMAKWQGFLLSDHVEAMQLKKERAQSLHPKPLLEQSLEEVSQRLYESFLRKLPVSMQLNETHEGQFDQDIVGFVAGYEGEQVYIQSFTECVTVEINTIRHIQLLSMEEYDHLRIKRKEWGI